MYKNYIRFVFLFNRPLFLVTITSIEDKVTMLFYLFKWGAS